MTSTSTVRRPGLGLLGVFASCEPPVPTPSYTVSCQPLHIQCHHR
jgi:hypothetical protein